VPYVSATLNGTPTDELTARAIAMLTDLTVEILRKERLRTTVVVRDDKARYVSEVNKALQALLGEASGYVAVEELAADSWGYAGEMQELHYLRSKVA